MKEELIFLEGDKVWVFGDERGVVIRETGPRIFLIRFEDKSEIEVDYMELIKR